jgi:two-component system, LytTR family, sensor histidine kinase AlgZ
MKSLPGELSQGQPNKATGEFLIPDLCSPRAVFVMVLLAELMVLVYALASSSLPRFNWDLLAKCSLFVQWVVLLSAALLCPLRPIYSHLSLNMASIASLTLVMTVAGLSSVVAMQLYPQLDYQTQSGWWVLRNVLVAMVLAGIALRYFYLQQQLKLREQTELQARLDSLRARIRPHFLFNTMNSIASLISIRPDAAEQAVEDLSELFRSSLQETNQPTTVADELRLCELYLGIEQLRLGDRLRVDWQIDEAVLDQTMPGLMLQPLVENAVYHGIAQLPDGGEICVQLEQREGKMQLCVTNPAPSHSRHTEGSHIALTNIQQRLFGLFGGDAGVTIDKGSDFFRIQLYYPLEENQ